MFVCRLLIFFKIKFLKKIFRNTIGMSNSLGPDQAQRFVGPDLGPNCLPRLSADDKEFGFGRLSSAWASTQSDQRLFAD